MIHTNEQLKNHLKELEERYNKQLKEADSLRAEIVNTQLQMLRMRSQDELDFLPLREQGRTFI